MQEAIDKYASLLRLRLQASSRLRDLVDRADVDGVALVQDDALERKQEF